MRPPVTAERYIEPHRSEEPEQLADNIAATILALTAEEIAQLDEISALRPEYPGWMVARQGQNRPPPPFVPTASA